MTEPEFHELSTDDPVAVLTLAIEATLSARAEDLPALSPSVAAVMASLLYPHGRTGPEAATTTTPDGVIDIHRGDRR